MPIVREGLMPYLGLNTYYRIVSPSTAPIKKKTPLVLLHGGPGSTHNYLEALDRVADEDQRDLVMYDQLGCGQSFVCDRLDLWKMSTWVDELEELRKYLGLDRIHLLGQSWGGMLLLHYVCNEEPQGLQSIILSSSLPSARMWGLEQERLLRLLPKPMQDAIDRVKVSGNYEDADYVEANREFMRRHACDEPTAKDPEYLTRPRKKGLESYLAAWGPNEFSPEGSLREFDVTSQLKDIEEPTLIISGTDDLCTPYVAKYMCDHIPGARWELFRGCRHMPYVEENDTYVAVLKAWLNEHDEK